MHKLSDLQELPFIVACGATAIVLSIAGITVAIYTLITTLRDGLQDLRRITHIVDSIRESRRL